MAHCYVEKLVASVANDRLPVFNQLVFDVNRPSNSPAILWLKDINDSQDFKTVIGSGVTARGNVGPQEKNITWSDGAVSGDGKLGIEYYYDIKGLSIQNFVPNYNFLLSISNTKMTEMSILLPWSFDVYDLNTEVKPLNSLVSLTTRYFLYDVITVKKLASLYPNIETMTLTENRITSPEEFSYHTHLSSLHLISASRIGTNVIEKMVKAYITSGRKTSGTLTYKKNGFSDTFNGKSLSSDVAYTVTWTASQINVTDGDQFNETMVL